MNHSGLGGPLSSAAAAAAAAAWAPDPLVIEALTRHVRPEAVAAAVAGTAERRKRRNRKVPAHAAVWLVIAIGLWGDADVPALWRQVVGTLASLWLAARGVAPPCKSALSQARSRLGARPLRRLFRATAAPLAAAG